MNPSNTWFLTHFPSPVFLCVWIFALNQPSIQNTAIFKWSPPSILSEPSPFPHCIEWRWRWWGFVKFDYRMFLASRVGLKFYYFLITECFLLAALVAIVVLMFQTKIHRFSWALESCKMTRGLSTFSMISSFKNFCNFWSRITFFWVTWYRGLMQWYFSTMFCLFHWMSSETNRSLESIFPSWSSDKVTSSSFSNTT